MPKLPYDLADLAPALSKDVVDLHYNYHHKTYVNNLNLAMEQLQAAIDKDDLRAVISLQPVIRFNAGSHINHSLYWENLAPASGLGGKLPLPGSPLYERVVKDWGSFERLIDYFTKRTAGIRGSGWGWLVMDRVTKALDYVETHDQDGIFMVPDEVPLLALDAWEHAYYLDYKNARGAYMKNIWKVVNWNVVETRYMKAAAHVIS